MSNIIKGFFGKYRKDLTTNDDTIRALVGDERYFGVQDIVIAKRVVATALERRRQIAKDSDDPNQLPEVFLLEKSMQEVGRRIPFTELGSYDSIHLFWLMSDSKPQMHEALVGYDFGGIRDMDDYGRFVDAMFALYFGNSIEDW